MMEPTVFHRIIPRLDIKGPNLVKGVNMEGLRVLGKPEDFAHLYWKAGADELFYMDAVASLYQRNSLLEIIQRTSEEIFIPLTVGGGLRSVTDVRKVLRAGADKVAINTAAIANPSLIKEVAEAFGSSTIVVSIEAIKRPNGTYECYTDYGRQSTGIDPIEWAKKAEELGAGELIVTAIDREGTGKGFDIPLTKRVAQLVSIPVIASGGAGSIEDVKAVLTDGHADAVSIASIFHYYALSQLSYNQTQFKEEGNLEFLTKGRSEAAFADMKPVSIEALKTDLASSGINCRQVIVNDEPTR